jgi:hypothetical protein
MKKTGLWLSLMFLIVLCCFLPSCKKQKKSPIYYNAAKDILKPEIVPSVPVNNTIVTGSGDYIYLIGTVTDKETEKSGGQLKNFTIKVTEVDPLGVLVANVLNITCPVDLLQGYIYKERFKTPLTNGHIYTVTYTAKDYANRETIVVHTFYY